MIQKSNRSRQGDRSDYRCLSSCLKAVSVMMANAAPDATFQGGDMRNLGCLMGVLSDLPPGRPTDEEAQDLTDQDLAALIMKDVWSEREARRSHTPLKLVENTQSSETGAVYP